MMLRLTAVIALFPDLGEAELLGWVERGWVQAERQEPDWVFEDIDVARVRLIHDFRRTMDVSEETMPLVLSLLDQVYGLRAQMQALAQALEQQPDDVRAAILARLRR
ncbi:MAG TPA: chaperone modulator CbpM [Rhodopila sp.]|nr:chaperone modulator CbpM [Rhodopila sp.]